MVWSFEYAIYSLERLGFADVILPFIIIFTIVFAALQKSKILGKDSKKFNVVISLVMGLSVVIPHVLWGSNNPNYPYLANGLPDAVMIMNSALPNISLVILAVVMVMLILGIIGGDVNFAGTSLGGLAIWGSILGVAFIFISSAGVFQYVPWWLQWIYDPYIKEMIMVILVFGIIIGFITKEDKHKGEKKISDALKDLSSGIFGGNK